MTGAASVSSRLFRRFRLPWVTRADHAVWREARSLAEVAALTAVWLEGGIASQPGYAPNWGPDDETTEVVPTLAAINRAGFLTDASQPGVPSELGYDGAVWQQRAAVSGFAGDDLVSRLRSAVAGTDLILTAHSPAAEDGCRCGVTVTRRCESGYTWFGSYLSPADRAWLYGSLCHPEAVNAVCGSWQVAVVDPEWGRDTVLWPVLDQLAADLSSTTAPRVDGAA